MVRQYSRRKTTTYVLKNEDRDFFREGEVDVLKKRTQSGQVQAVDDKGLTLLLERLGVLDSVGKDARCARCGNLVILDGITAVYPENGIVRFICDNPKCAAWMVPPDVR